MSTARANCKEEPSLQNFKPAFQEFLRKRDIPCNGNKQELGALAFSASVMDVCVKPSNEERMFIKAREYAKLLAVDGKSIPDPLSDLLDGWQGEDEGMKKWPRSMIQDLSFHLEKK